MIINSLPLPIHEQKIQRDVDENNIITHGVFELGVSIRNEGPLKGDFLQIFLINCIKM